jgi:hypothetical protein
MTSHLAEMIRWLGQKETISLWGHGLGNEDAAALSNALKVNTLVTVIDLGDNQIGDEGATALADALKVNTSVTTISLLYNQIDSEGASALADALKVNTSVTTIDLRGNQIGDAGGAALAEALKLNTSVTEIWLGGNGIDESIIATFGELTTRNKRLRHLFLFDARRMLLSLMCADECGVVWPYLLESGNITDGVAAPNDIDALRATLDSIVVERLRDLFLYDARQMLLSLMCADECGVVWPYLLEINNITDGVAAPDNIDELRATFASLVANRLLHQ